MGGNPSKGFQPPYKMHIRSGERTMIQPCSACRRSWISMKNVLNQ